MSVTINGTDGVSKVKDGTVTSTSFAAGAVDATALASGAVTQPKVGSNVVGNGPAFGVSFSGTQSISAATYTKVAFNVENFDTSNCFDTSTYRFTPNVAGYYQISLGLACDATVTNPTQTNAYIYKNGSVYKANFQYASGTGILGVVVVTLLLYLNGTTDYVEAYGRISGGSGLIFNGGDNSWFTGFLARAA